MTSPSARLADYFTFSGLAKSLTNFGRTEKAKITAASKNVSAFFDPELGLTVAALPKTEIEKERYLGYSAHEAIHREISQLGLEEFLETDTGSRLSDKIQNYMGVNLENLLSESHGRLRAEELLAHLAEYEVLCGVGLEKLEDAGITIPFLQHENLYFNDYHRILDFVFKNYGDSSLNPSISHFLLTAKKGESGLNTARRIGRVLSANSPVTLATGIDFNLADVPRFISQRGLETQIKLLERLLPLLGYKKSDIKSYFELLNAEKSMFLQRLASHPHPLAVALGASSPLAISDDSSVVLDVVNELAVLLTDISRKCGLVVGNSRTGFTEAFSSSWANTSERANGREYMQQTPIFRIPLAWDVTDIADGLPQTASTAIDSLRLG